MRLSGEEVFIVPSRYPDKVFVYAPLRSYLAVTSFRNGKALSSVTSTAEQEALVKRLRQRLEIPHFRIPTIAGWEPRIQRLTISLSDACNLRCVYCRTYRPNHRAQTLPETILEPLIAAFVRLTTAPVLYFEFLGDGEPTLCFELLKRCVRAIRIHKATRPFVSKILLTTNGCFGAAVRSYLLKNFDEITVSFDGFKLIQDFQRPRSNGRSSFQAVYDNVRFLYQADAAVILRITVTPFSIGHLHAILAFFGESFPGIAVRVEAVRPAGRAIECFPDLSDFSEQVAKAISRSPILRSKALTVAKPFNGDGTMYDSIRTIGCPMLEFGNWKVASGGNVFCCDALEPSNPLFLGSCDLECRSVPAVTERIAQLRESYYVGNNDFCADCFCKYHCAGGCPLLWPTDAHLHCDEIRKRGVDWLHARAFPETTPSQGSV